MGVDRTDYLMFGAKVDVDFVQKNYDDLVSEIEGRETARFDVVYDGMTGEYAIAGFIIAFSDPDDGFDMKRIDTVTYDRDAVIAAVTAAFGNVDGFGVYLFSHYYY